MLELKIKVLNLLASISYNTNEEYAYYRRALELDPTTVSKNILAELYYKYALASENLDDERTAVEYYKKCIEIKENSYLSAAMSNLAQIYDDLGETDIAIKFYSESIKIDEKTRNLNGIYQSTLRLAQIYSISEPEKAVLSYNKALGAAVQLNETFYMMTISTELGDFYLNRKLYDQALENYRIAYKYSSESIYKENKEKIQLRIDELKDIVGEDKFNEL